MSIIGSELLLASAAATGYQVERSLRFNSSDSAFCGRSFSSAGNQKTWSWSAWVKKCNVSTQQSIWSAGSTGTNRSNVLFQGGGEIRFFNYAGSVNVDLVTTPVFRDPSAWYHILVAVDTTQATSTNRFKLYVNGTQITTFSTATYPSQNQDLVINSAITHGIGRGEQSGGEYFDGYLADVIFIDGQQLTPSSLVEVSATTGRLEPKQYAGSFGTNGFWLKFSDNSAATATTLGKDYSGNSNNWTPNNLSVTAGAGNDSLVDTPTSYGADTGAGGEVRGNYATLNAINKGTSITLSNGNLDYTQSTTSTNNRCISTIYVSSGKWYVEHTVTTTNAAVVVGIASASEAPSSNFFGATAKSYGYAANGQKYTNGSGSTYGASYGTAGDVIGIAFDADAGTLTYYKNGVSQGTAFSSIPADSYYFGQGNNSEGYSGSFNFGQRQWAYAAPSGFRPLVDTLLPSPVVAKPSTVMDVKLWTGNGSSQTISGLGFSPDLVWIKARSQGIDWHALFNTVVGATTRLFSNSTSAEATNAQTLTAFNSDGFSVGNTSEVNGSSTTYVGWCWDAGSSTVTNTQGSITSQVRANASAGFSIVTYTGTGANATVGHGCGTAPSMMFVKSRSAANGWAVYHVSIGNTYELILNSTSAASGPNGTYWNSTSPTSTVFSLGTDSWGNASGGTYVAYCFSPVAGYSSFGSYTGNGSADGPFVFCNFRPRWVLFKNTNSGENWRIMDAARNTYNVVNSILYPNLSNAEGSSAVGFDILSNGFKIRESGSELNASGATIVYAAFAESPFAYSRAR